MGPNSNIRYAIFTIWVILILNFSGFILSSSSHSVYSAYTSNYSTNLDDYLYNYSTRSLAHKSHTGVLYNITNLPSKFSNMKISILRLRSRTLWSQGANFSYFDIPPKIITIPYVKRLSIMYENFGNLSSHYFDLPGYTFLTKVIGIAVYNASDLSGNTSFNRLNLLNLTSKGEVIMKVKFTRSEEFTLSSLSSARVGRHNNTKENMLRKCVRFDPISSLVELSDMLSPNTCLSQGLGHFAIAMPIHNDSILSPPPSSSPSPLFSPSITSKSRRERKRNIAIWLWWMIGFLVGIISLTTIVLCFVIGYKIFRLRKLEKMEKIAEKNISLQIKWIGNSKLPMGSMSRTQGVLEEDLAP
ncbi:uncharacterized protein LOC130811390 [Amaranthus tricolor]|uniref:uncharacterized protein LOC130811390 n=1 Tax=Amaranthus tricolor TaxID=29722 RepID=UPI0025857070|nr:uncharacterized protein LOC130811390 [Amaranthus tricolor]